MAERRGAGGDERRIKRVEREVRDVIARYLIGGFRGELSGLVSVSRVGMAGDFRSGKVFISVMGEPGEAEVSLKSLRENAYDIQKEVDRQLKMQFCPKLSFHLDESMEHVLKVEKILRDISAKNAAGDDGGNGGDKGSDDAAEDSSTDDAPKGSDNE